MAKPDKLNRNVANIKFMKFITEIKLCFLMFGKGPMVNMGTVGAKGTKSKTSCNGSESEVYDK